MADGSDQRNPTLTAVAWGLCSQYNNPPEQSTSTNLFHNGGDKIPRDRAEHCPRRESLPSTSACTGTPRVGPVDLPDKAHNGAAAPVSIGHGRGRRGWGWCVPCRPSAVGQWAALRTPRGRWGPTQDAPRAMPDESVGCGEAGGGRRAVGRQTRERGTPS